MHHKKSEHFTNPQLDETEHDSGMKYKGGTHWATETFVHVNHKGVPVHLIDPDAYITDVASYWARHEYKLWVVLACCLLFLAFKLLGS